MCVACVCESQHTGPVGPVASSVQGTKKTERFPSKAGETEIGGVVC